MEAEFVCSGHLYQFENIQHFQPGCTYSCNLFSQYNASHLVLVNDEDIVSEASSHLIKCIQDFEGATVIRYSIRRSPNSVINFLPGKCLKDDYS